MAPDTHALTEKEKETLRLIVRGHDAKSSARHLGLSVHTINERLRDARRKLEVSSSREAARLLLKAESTDPQNQADKQIGEATPTRLPDKDSPGTSPARSKRQNGVIAGVTFMFAALIALSLIADGTPPSTATNAPVATAATAVPAVAETDAVRAARDWLVLGDQGRWNEGWQATAASFRKANTAQQWADAATKVRVPMGALVSRTALSEDSVPAPPGVELIKFRASFANRAAVTETVALVREEGRLKVVGIYVE